MKKWKFFCLQLIVVLTLRTVTSQEQDEQGQEEDGENISCEGYYCPDGQSCVMQGVRCITSTCLQEPTCVDREIRTCQGYDCPDGQVCLMWQPVQCITADTCPQEPTCVGEIRTCQNLQCPDNQLCLMEEEDCDNVPCPSRPKCVSRSAICKMPIDTGPCDSIYTRFYYDPDFNICERFYYGGCEGNANNFETEDECRETCFVCPLVICNMYCEYGRKVDAWGCDICECLVSVCEQPSDESDCGADLRPYVQRYFFNQESQMCELFGWNGCGGNENNFATHQECSVACMPVAISSERLSGCPDKPTCTNICEFGYKSDEIGCINCDCKDQ